MIAPGFGFTRDFLKERNNSAYCRLKKIPCEFKEQARARHPGEKCGLNDDTLDEEEIIAAICKFPSLLQRPIVISGNKAIIGRPPLRVLEIIA